MKRLTMTMLAAALYLACPAVQYSKLAIVAAAKAAGKWDALKAWIASAGYQDEWQAAAFLSDTYPQFATITNAVIMSGVASQHEVALILAASVDTAPDAILAWAYIADMKTSSGRARWHGGAPVPEYRTNETTRIIERVDIYPDGWEYVDTASRRRALTPEEAAERAAKRRNASADRVRSLEARISALQSSLTVPATNDELIVSQANARLQIVSLQRTLDRLRSRSQTNVVTVVVAP